MRYGCCHTANFRSYDMKKQLILLAALSVAFTGCMKPTTHSIGAALMPAPIMHRSSPDSSVQELSVAASGFYGHSGDGYNLENLNAFGGNIGLTYRMAGTLSPLFLNVAAGVFGGSLHFGCDASHRCLRDSEFDKDYVAWLESKAGRKSYSFWNLQERILVGADFSPAFLIVGGAIGFQLYEGSSDYDRMRNRLGNEGLMDSRGKNSGVDITSSVWLGTYLGRRGQFGNLVAEYDVIFKDKYDDAMASIKWTYTHPSGFFGGFARGDLIDFSLFVGKQFVF